MRIQTVRLLLAALALAGLAACAPSPGSSPTPSASPAGSSPPQTTAGTLAPDTETTVPAPPPSAPPAPSAGAGAGNAELAIMVKPSPDEPAVNYTLVCSSGLPAPESQHPGPDAACAALRNNAALLSPPTRNTDQACTEQYGGPQQAIVTGIVDGVPVDVSFARTNGCEIGAWDAARDVLGSSGGAA